MLLMARVGSDDVGHEVNIVVAIHAEGVIAQHAGLVGTGDQITSRFMA